MTPKISICIPTYNSRKTIEATIASCQMQDYPNKEILISDDCSTDETADFVERFNLVRVIRGDHNIGIGHNLIKIMNQARGKYVVYICADDLFTHPSVVSDIVNQFDNGDPAIGVISRFFYFFMDGHDGAIGVCRDRNILTSACCPSGMAFRKIYGLIPTNKIFIEMPSIVAQYLKEYRWTMLEYDTIAARFHPGGNTGTKKSYYKESPLQNWIDLTGDKKFAFHEGFIQLKNRAPQLLIPEIKLAIKMNPDVLKEFRFWLFAGVAVLFPGWLLRKFTNFYRHRITRHHVKVINRGEEPVSGSYTKKGVF